MFTNSYTYEKYIQGRKARLRRKVKETLLNVFGSVLLAVIFYFLLLLGLANEPTGHYEANPDKTADIHYIWVED